jgi:phytoene synthase
VDDFADDGNGTRSERHEKLEGWRRDLAALYEGKVSAQVRFLAPAVARYGLRLQDFLSVLDGMDMDVAEDIVAPDLATLDLYCDRVASAVGRLSIKVFGMEEEPGFELAHHLGRALQLTNILRDIDEDAAIGRLYLPREYLEEMDCCRQMDPLAIIARPQIDAVCRRVAKLAHQRYDQANRILAARPKGRIKTPRLMGAVYSEILSATEAQGFAPPRRRISLPKSRLLSLVLRQGLFS